MRAALFAAICCVLRSAEASCQAVDTTHRFGDVPNVLLTGIETTALIADGAITRHALDRHPHEVREADWLAAPFVSNGWTGQMVGGAVVVAAGAGVQHWLHTSGHHTLERLVPLVPALISTYCAINNQMRLDMHDGPIQPGSFLAHTGRSSPPHIIRAAFPVIIRPLTRWR